MKRSFKRCAARASTAAGDDGPGLRPWARGSSSSRCAEGLQHRPRMGSSSSTSAGARPTALKAGLRRAGPACPGTVHHGLERRYAEPRPALDRLRQQRPPVHDRPLRTIKLPNASLTTCAGKTQRCPARIQRLVPDARLRLVDQRQPGLHHQPHQYDLVHRGRQPALHLRLPALSRRKPGVKRSGGRRMTAAAAGCDFRH